MIPNLEARNMLFRRLNITHFYVPRQRSAQQSINRVTWSVLIADEWKQSEWGNPSRLGLGGPVWCSESQALGLGH